MEPADVIAAATAGLMLKENVELVIIRYLRREGITIETSGDTVELV